MPEEHSPHRRGRHSQRRAGRVLRWVGGTLAVVLGVVIWRAGQPPAAEGVQPVYDQKTGVLEEIAFDSDHDGRPDMWSFMDGAQLLRVEIDKDQDGRMDRWEYYDANRRIERVGFSRANDGKVDTWAFQGADGQVERIEATTQRNGVVDRWEYYAGNMLQRVEHDTSGDGKPDKWDAYSSGRLAVVSFDENADGQPDRRLTYGPGGRLLLMETDPDGKGGFTHRTEIGK